MRLSKGRILLATATALALIVGVGTAIAATGGGGLKQEAARIIARSSFEASVATNLGTTAAKLEAAVKAAATARIDAALAADEITAAEAATLKEAMADGSVPAMRLATAGGVAKQLNTSEAKLNAAFSTAQKAHLAARVDEALKAGDINEKRATELKAKIDVATFPGFGAGVLGRHGGRGGPGGHRGPRGSGMGFGPPPAIDRPATGSPSSSSTPATLAAA